MTRRDHTIAFLGVPEFWRRALTLALARFSPCVPEIVRLDHRLEGLVADRRRITIVRCSAERSLSPRLRRLIVDGGARVVVIDHDGRHVTLFAPGGSRRWYGVGIDRLATLIANAEDEARG